MPAEQWYYRLDGRPHGPFTAGQFEKLIRGKTVTPDTEVSLDGQTWKSLREVLAGEPAAPPGGSVPDWMSAPTLVPGDVKRAPGLKPGTKHPPA